VLATESTYYNGAGPCARTIAGYEPASDVIQHNRLDLDQKEMEEHLKTPDFIKAKGIYEDGAHSGAHARVTVSPLTAALAKGAAVVQAGHTAARGYVKKAKSSGVTEVDITYTSACVNNIVSKDHSVAGCYNTAGALTVGDAMDIGTPSNLENRYRTLLGSQRPPAQRWLASQCSRSSRSTTAIQIMVIAT
jgi:hypothetical protein